MKRISDPVALTVGAPTMGHVRITPKPQLTDAQVKKLLALANGGNP